ncbi:MAG: acyltransferase family protein [Polyangiaceae bacterium]|nr:acyltransferase family protein [Polyangiaceae bacterium]
MPLLIDKEVWERVLRLELPFNSCGVDPYGISREHVARTLTMLRFLYRHYFSVRVSGIENIPRRGRAMLIGNHSGGIAVDGAMVVASCFFEMEPPRLAQGMAEKFINKVPFFSLWSSRTGQITGLPEHAAKLLQDERLVMTFPEGARGTAKLFRERHSLVQFGTGFMRLALQTKSPIIPFAFLGGGEAIPTIMNSYALGALVGAPYIPITPYLLPVPLPVRLELYYGEPMIFEGTGAEGDEVITGYVEQVKARIAGMIERGKELRKAESAGASTPAGGEGRAAEGALDSARAGADKGDA